MNELIVTPRGDAAAVRRIVMAHIGAGQTVPGMWLTTTLLRPGQVAALLQVSRRTVTTWAGSGMLPSIRTPGGHRRFRAADVYALVESLVVHVPVGYAETGRDDEEACE